MSTLPDSPQFGSSSARNRLAPYRLGLAGLALASLFIVSCKSSPPKADVVVSVKDQKLGIYDPSGKLVQSYRISTSKFGLGDQPGSNRTPLGKHEIVAKIGHGLPEGAVLKSRQWNGEVLPPNAPGRDPIVSRILWLKGLENQNSNAYRRFIYIHGTPEESNLGKPASYGCIRMGMTDVIQLFNELGIGTTVEITKNRLPRG
jgi:lipoprotein-anchoring transpeptidase ErfK/SrfK